MKGKIIHLPIFIFLAVLITGFVDSRSFLLRELPDVLTKDKDRPDAYENQGMYHSTYFIIKPNNSFVYYSIFEVGYDLSFGNYKLQSDTIIFNTDWDATAVAVKDSSIYNQYFKHSFPRPYLISNEKYLIGEEKIKRIK